MTSRVLSGVQRDGDRQGDHHTDDERQAHALKVMASSTQDQRDELLRDFLQTCYPTLTGQNG